MKGQKLYLFLIALIEWATLIAQYIVLLNHSQAEITESTVRFFSYFTILTNIIVAIFATAQWFAKLPNKGFFGSANTQTAITMYITVVGIVFNLVLRSLLKEGGIQSFLSDILHCLTPLLMIIYWWKFTDGQKLTYKCIPLWLLYPALYAIYILLRGPFATWYPYPFMNVIELGYPKVLLNSGILVLVFLFFSLLFVRLGKRKPKPTSLK